MRWSLLIVGNCISLLRVFVLYEKTLCKMTLFSSYWLQLRWLLSRSVDESVSLTHWIFNQEIGYEFKIIWSMKHCEILNRGKISINKILFILQCFFFLAACCSLSQRHMSTSVWPTLFWWHHPDLRKFQQQRKWFRKNSQGIRRVPNWRS